MIIQVTSWVGTGPNQLTPPDEDCSWSTTPMTRPACGR